MAKDTPATNRALGTARLALLLALTGLAGCSGLEPSCGRGEAIVQVTALEATSVEVRFGCALDRQSAAEPSRFSVAAYTATPPEDLPVVDAKLAADDRVLLSTAPQTGGVTYTLRVEGLRDASGAEIAESANFTGIGDRRRAELTFVVDDSYHQQQTEVWLLVSVDPETGAFSPRSHRMKLAKASGDHRFEGPLSVAVDPARTVDPADDDRNPAFVAYSVRAVDPENRPLSDLLLFAVPDAEPQLVELPLRDVPLAPGPEGLATVRFVVDDRPARALSAPSLSGSFDDDGRFDPGFPTLVPLADDDGDGIWEGTARVRINPARTLDGDREQSRPYSVHLVEAGEAHTARSADFVIPDEKPIEVSILIGSADRVPVTFRVDVSAAWLDPEGQSKGLYPGEAVFLTGELGQAEDAFGRNASDAFSGGENVVLQMVEHPDHPGVWQRTIFLPKNRPYGWKVVRCPRDQGCSQLNKMVISSGRAFLTVMKNLVTELCDLSKTTFTDPDCATPKLIDPRALATVDTGQGILDYRSAKVFIGTGQGAADQDDPPGTPSAALMFKQEAPDLVVDVTDKPLTTPVVVVGTWRDVNIPGTPAEIASSGQVVALTDTDYDGGQVGATPPTYELTPPTKPSPFALDGQLDAAAELVAGGTAQMMPLYAALSSDGAYLYLATDDAGEGSDNFILASATPPAGARPAPWGKSGEVAFAGKTLVLADENDSAFAGWFELGTPDLQLVEQGQGPLGGLDLATAPQNGGKLEGVIHLATVFGATPAKIYLAAGPWQTSDGGTLYSGGQAPATSDGDGNVDAAEILELDLTSLKK